AYLEGERVRFDAHESVRAGETEEAARVAVARGYTTVAVVGGDGTLSAAASGYFEPCAPLAPGELPRAVNPAASLAILPAGTGDDFARGLTGGRREPLAVWLARLVNHTRADEEGRSGLRTGGERSAGLRVDEEGSGGLAGQSDDASPQTSARGRPETTRSVDVLLGSVDGGLPGGAGGSARRFVCLNAATLGIGAEVAGRVAAQRPTVRRLPGEARFAWAALQSLAAWRDRRVRVRVDGGEWTECRTNLIAVVNGTYAGGGMNFSPEARLDDGLLDVLMVCRLSRAALLRELARVRRGGHLANPKVKLTRATRVRVETHDPADSLPVEADGDVRGHTPAEFQVMPGALRLVF
ncbi:MAG TPA: diacylglycerol kinase family protein, partial [Pyrinomonadaceae bacterium]|nr:diacylglycerol kinase family protein [Pyrinomonadaceae bacterium]